MHRPVPLFKLFEIATPGWCKLTSSVVRMGLAETKANVHGRQDSHREKKREVERPVGKECVCGYVGSLLE